ncbi:MAG: aminotransferase class IV [Micromonosporaceae bacterium]
MRIEIDGRTAATEQLAYPAVVNYGHYTAMQVRGGRVRGLALHLTRLRDASRELFDAELDGELVRERVRHALGGTADASVQVRIFAPDASSPASRSGSSGPTGPGGTDRPGGSGPPRPGGTSGELSVMVLVREAVEMPSAPWRLKSVPYLRPVAHLKHVGGFGQAYYGRVAQRDGFDDALLTGPGGAIAEAGIANVGFFAGDALVWPDAPALPGISYQLLVEALGARCERRAVTLADVGSYDGSFVCNSWGVAPVGQIDERRLPVATSATASLVALYEAVPAEPV